MTERDKPLILVVEDDETQRLVAVEVLRAQGFLAEGATDGEDGLRKARVLKPDVVMLDVLMPGLDGFAVCRTMRDDPDLQAIPAVQDRLPSEAEVLAAPLIPANQTFNLLREEGEWRIILAPPPQPDRKLTGRVERATEVTIPSEDPSRPDPGR